MSVTNMKTFPQAIFLAEQESKLEPKLNALSGLDTDSLRLVCEALNPYRIFNIKKFDYPKIYSGVDPDYSEFFSLLDDLHTHRIVGNDAKTKVTSVLSKYTQNTSKYLGRVLTKDLKCSAGISIFKKVYPDLDIPEFDLMGAMKMTPKYKFQFPCICEAKYDGQRAIIMVKGNRVEYLSRNGKTLDHLEGLFDHEAITFSYLLGFDCIIDGEALAGSFQESIRAKGSKNDTAKSALKFYAFDYMKLSEWESQYCPVTQENRSKNLEQLIKEVDSEIFIKSKYRIVESLTEAQEFYTEVIQDGISEDGTANGLGEGLIVKYMDSLYQWNLGGSRGPEWTKWKPVLDIDLTITGFYEGKAGTKNKGKLGGITLEGRDENSNKVKTDCGGFKVSHPKMKDLLISLGNKCGVQFFDPKGKNYVKNRDQFLREYIWNHQDEFLGKTAMLEAQELTLAEGSDVYSLRFPQFVTIRDDK